jgi:hypothetical protein
MNSYTPFYTLTYPEKVLIYEQCVPVTDYKRVAVLVTSMPALLSQRNVVFVEAANSHEIHGSRANDKFMKDPAIYSTEK